MSAFLAMLGTALLAEREAEGVEQRPTLVVGAGGRHERDVHAAGGVDLVVVDLREDQLLGDAERVVAVAVEAAGVEAPEVADTGDGEADQAVEELPHAVAPEGDPGADGVALTELEAGDRLRRLRHDGLLAGDALEVAHGALEQAGLAEGGADAHVEGDLRQARHLHDVGEAERLLELRLD